MDFLYWTICVLLWPYVRLWYRWHFRGLGKIPQTGGVLLASNHISFVDPIVLGYLGWRFNRPIRFLAKSELFEKKVMGIPVLGFLLRALGQIEVHRGTREAAASLEPAERELENGAWISIFPEGTISYETFEPMEPKTGVGRIASVTGAPVVPVAIWGSQRAITKHRKPNWALGTDVMVVCGDPIYAGPEEDPVAFAERVMKEITSLLDDAMLEYPVEAAPGDDWWLPPRLRS